MVRFLRRKSDAGETSKRSGFVRFVIFARNLFKMKTRRKRRLEIDAEEESCLDETFETCEDCGSTGTGDDGTRVSLINASTCSVRDSVGSFERKRSCMTSPTNEKICNESETEPCVIGHHVRVAIGRKNSKRNVKSWVCSPCPLGDIWIGDWHNTHLTKLNCCFSDPQIGDHTGDNLLKHLEQEGYSLKKELTRGNFGCRFLAYSSQLNSDVTVKLLTCKHYRCNCSCSKSESEYLSRTEERIQRELDFHRQLSHPALLDAITSYSMNSITVLVTEFCEMGNLENILSARPGNILTETVSRRYFKQILSVITYFHEQNIVHLDLNCKNFEVNCYDKVKLCDLSSARKHFLDEPPYVISCGSEEYRSPEVVQRIPLNPRSVDIWALGVILFKMITGKFPFEPNLSKHMLVCCISEGPCFPEGSVLPLSQEIKLLFNGIFKVDPKGRYSLRRVSNSSWLQTEETQISIGNYHLLKNPRKILVSGEEQKLKLSFGI